MAEGQPSQGQPDRILLVGMMGSGKTTVGRRLARRLRVPYVDNDDVLKERTAMSPGDLLDATDAETLHRAEVEAIDEALASHPRAVIGVAAAVVLDSDARRHLRESGEVVWLRADPDTLERRLSRGGRVRRPQFAADMHSWLRSEAAARAPLYAEVAHRTVDVDGRSPEQVVDEILRAARAGAG